MSPCGQPRPPCRELLAPPGRPDKYLLPDLERALDVRRAVAVYCGAAKEASCSQHARSDVDVLFLPKKAVRREIIGRRLSAGAWQRVQHASGAGVSCLCHLIPASNKALCHRCQVAASMRMWPSML